MDVRYDYATPVIQRFSTETNDFILGGASGEVLLRIPLLVINTYAIRSYVYDIRETYSDTTGIHRYQGVIRVWEMSTRDE